MSNDKGFNEEIEWLKEKANGEGVSTEEKRMLLRIANNYSYTKGRLDEKSLNESWAKNPERMGR